MINSDIFILEISAAIQAAINYTVINGSHFQGFGTAGDLPYFGVLHESRYFSRWLWDSY